LKNGSTQLLASSKDEFFPAKNLYIKKKENKNIQNGLDNYSP
jgi:hypothetical protein